MPAVHETAYPRLKPHPTAAELERLYTPTPAEHQLAQTVTKGPVARITFLVLLKTFQRLGYFVLLKDVPDRIVQHIITTTTIPLRIADLAGYDVSGTRKRHVAAIRTHMQVQPYNATARRLLIHALMIAAQTKNDVADLINIGIEELIRLRYELPAFKPLHRVARHSRAVTHRRLYTQIQQALGPMIQAQLDALLVSDPTTHDTPWNRLKQDPGTPTLTHLKLLIDHLTWLIALPNVRGALAVLADVKLKYFAADANTLDAARMQALMPAKRITLLAALVVVQTARAYDDVAEMFVKRMLAIHQKAKDALAAYQVAHQAQTDKLVLTLRNLLIAFQGTGTADERIHSMDGVLPESTDDLVTACDAYLAYSGNNYYPFMWNCYRSHRPTLFRIVNILTFESTSQNTDFLAALGV